MNISISSINLHLSLKPEGICPFVCIGFMGRQSFSTPPSSKSLCVGLGGLLALLLLGGCQTPVGVSRVDPETVRHELSRNALSTGETSHFSDNVLHITDLTETYADEPPVALFGGGLYRLG